MSKPTPHRNNQLAQIHIARAQLGLDEDTYRAAILLISNNRTDSSAQLDYAERNKLLDHFKARGWKNAKTARPASPPETTAQIKKIGALLADMKLSWNYAHGIAKQMYKRERVQWCKSHELKGIITALIKKRGTGD